MLLSLHSSSLPLSLSTTSITELLFSTDLSISGKATNRPVTEASLKTSKLAVTSAPLSKENGLEKSIRPSTVQIDKQYSDVLQPSFYWPSNTITILPVTLTFQFGPSDVLRLTETSLTPSLLTDGETNSTKSDMTASHTPSLPTGSIMSAPCTPVIPTEIYMNASLTFSLPEADMSASLTYNVRTSAYLRDLFSQSTQADGPYNSKHTFIEGSELKKIYVSTKPTNTDYIELVYNQSKHVKSSNTTDRKGLTRAEVMFKMRSQHKTTGITISKHMDLYDLYTNGKQGYTEFVSRFSSSFSDASRVNHGVQPDSSSLPFHSLYSGPFLSILDTHHGTQETYFINSSDAEIGSTHFASDAVRNLGKHGSIKNTELRVKDGHNISKDFKVQVFSAQAVTVNQNSRVVPVGTELSAKVELANTETVAEHNNIIKSEEKEIVGVPESYAVRDQFITKFMSDTQLTPANIEFSVYEITHSALSLSDLTAVPNLNKDRQSGENSLGFSGSKIKQKDIVVNASNTYFEQGVSKSYSLLDNVTPSETKLSTDIEQDMAKLQILYKESNFRTMDTHPELTVDDIRSEINRSISVQEEFRTTIAASAQQTDQTIGSSSQETQSFYCRCDENTMSLPHSFSQYQGI